jgi:hypothetical protein
MTYQVKLTWKEDFVCHRVHEVDVLPTGDTPRTCQYLVLDPHHDILAYVTGRRYSTPYTSN